MLLEQSATSFYAGRYLRAIAWLIASLVRYPLKSGVFFGQIARRALLMARAPDTAETRECEPGRFFSSLTDERVLVPRRSKRKA
jgi:hypothetical protein